MHNPLEAMLIRRIAQGDIEALGELYDTYSTSLYSLAFRILNHSGEAEEILLQSFLQIWQDAYAFDETKGKPLSWVVQIIRNQATKRLRALKPDPCMADLSWGNAIETDGALQPWQWTPEDETEELGSAVKALPNNERRAIELAYFGGLSYIEIAKVLNEPPGRIKDHIRRGMVSLRDAVEFKALT